MLRKERQRHGFTLVELLVVIGIIAVLLSIIMPAINRSRTTAERVACMSNMRQVGMMLIMYAQDNGGYMYPVGPKDPATGIERHFGTNIADPWGRWPVMVFKPPVPNPPIMICPRDLELGRSDSSELDKHSYILNKHLSYQNVRYHRYPKNVDKTTIVVMGEKKTEYYDYYMEVENYGKPNAQSDYDRLVELYRHGLQGGSNLLYLDGHVDNERPELKPGAIDPWQVEVQKPEDLPKPLR